MATNQTLTMFAWMFKKDTWADVLVRLGFGGFILAPLLTDAVKQLRPSAGVNCLICLTVALLLALPVLLGISPKDSRLRAPILTLAIAYSWMSLLYFFDSTNLIKIPNGFDAVTDVVGTFFFVAAWFFLSVGDSDKQSQGAERFALTILCLFLLISAASKLVIDLKIAEMVINLKIPQNESNSIIQLLILDASTKNLVLDGMASRLMLNLCNGVVLLSLYGQMRRLLPPPDPITHVIILLFGCAQIAAHGRDCLTKQPLCEPSSLAWIVAFGIAWTLLLGKIAFGAYVSYLYFNGRISEDGKTEKSNGTINTEVSS